MSVVWHSIHSRAIRLNADRKLPNNLLSLSLLLDVKWAKHVAWVSARRRTRTFQQKERKKLEACLMWHRKHVKWNGLIWNSHLKHIPFIIWCVRSVKMVPPRWCLTISRWSALCCIISSRFYDWHTERANTERMMQKWTLFRTTEKRKAKKKKTNRKTHHNKMTMASNRLAHTHTHTIHAYT